MSTAGDIACIQLLYYTVTRRQLSPLTHAMITIDDLSALLQSANCIFRILDNRPDPLLVKKFCDSTRLNPKTNKTIKILHYCITV